MGDIVPTIAKLREQKGLTQRQLADAVGVTETTIANWEKGRSGTDWFVRISKLCQALDVDPTSLYQDVPVAGSDSPGAA